MTEDLNRERANAESVFTLNRRAEFVMTAHFADLPPWIDWSPSALAEEVSRTYAENTPQSGVFSRQQRCVRKALSDALGWSQLLICLQKERRPWVTLPRADRMSIFRRSERIFVLFLNKLPQTFGPSSFIGRIMWSYSFQKR